ncbi:hypothetical protein CK203_040345 [Vitis vinifera]|uniref:Uncharacterized protein n=1 Tax=Vitis vinifera TaxID=29760 RepID=A0A438FX26_VITVI|nr:hypothetical protein CK203_040345 [Vitis vinifera]
MKGEESSSKAEQGRKPRKQSTQFQGAKIFAHLISSQELNSLPAHKLRHLWNPEHPPPSFRPWQRPEEAIPPPHPHRHLDHSEPPWEPRLHLLFRPRPFPHLRGKFLLSADTPPEATPDPVPPVDQATSPVSRPPSEEDQVLGSWRAIPRTSARASYRGTRIPVGHASRGHYQASHDSRTTD